jgi:hypothetical protein
MEVRFVYAEVGTEFVNMVQMKVMLQRMKQCRKIGRSVNINFEGNGGSGLGTCLNELGRTTKNRQNVYGSKFDFTDTNRSATGRLANPNHHHGLGHAWSVPSS